MPRGCSVRRAFNAADRGRLRRRIAPETIAASVAHPLKEALHVSVKDLLLVVFIEVLVFLHIIERLGKTFGMRKVASEKYALNRDMLDAFLWTVLLERRHEDSAVKCIARVAIESLRHLEIGIAHLN